MAFYGVEPTRYRINIHEGHTWGLPGVHCPACDAIWSSGALALPCVDLSSLPEAVDLAEPRLEEDFNKFLRLREAIRPLVPKEVKILHPGTEFGPAIGPASGTRFGPLTMGFPWMMLGRPEGVTFLEAEGIRGVKAGPTNYRFRSKPQEVLELQIEPYGQAHPDCLPPARSPPCSTCGRLGLVLPNPLILEKASLPADRDIFRLVDFEQVIIVTDRFVEAVKRLGCDDLTFKELSVR